MTTKIETFGKAHPKKRAKTSTDAARKRKQTKIVNLRRRVLLRHLPAWLILALVLVILLPNVLSATLSATGRALDAIPRSLGRLIPLTGDHPIAPLFTAEVDYWAEDIDRWADEHDLDPNLLATVMQIESCGRADAVSVSGAQGLFQVMPFHFADGEVYTDPETNARRGASFLKQCLTDFADGDPALAMACYNGGPSVTFKPFNQWHSETQRYYTWGKQIYADAVANQSHSATLDAWLDAGGAIGCELAAAEQQ